MNRPSIGTNHPLIGKYISTETHDRLIEGIVVLFIRGGDQLTQDQMEQYAQIEPEHGSYKSVRGPAGIDRVVLDRDNGGYWIAPVHIFVGSSK